MWHYSCESYLRRTIVSCCTNLVSPFHFNRERAGLARQHLGGPARSGASPRRRAWNPDMCAWQHDAETAAAVLFLARPHSRFPISNFRFLTSDFQFPLAPALSTFNYQLSPFSSTLLESISIRRAQKRESSGLKLFGMSKCTARTQKNRPRKCPGMRALQSMRVSSPLESVFAKNLGPTPAWVPCPRN